MSPLTSQKLTFPNRKSHKFPDLWQKRTKHFISLGKSPKSSHQVTKSPKNSAPPYEQWARTCNWISDFNYINPFISFTSPCILCCVCTRFRCLTQLTQLTRRTFGKLTQWILRVYFKYIFIAFQNLFRIFNFVWRFGYFL